MSSVPSRARGVQYTPPTAATRSMVEADDLKSPAVPQAQRHAPGRLEELRTILGDLDADDFDPEADDRATDEFALDDLVNEHSEHDDACCQSCADQAAAARRRIDMPQSKPSPSAMKASTPTTTSAKALGKARMHRISTVREREGVSLRSASRQMRVDVRRLRDQEDESADILLSTLYKWQKVLDVPISELLVDSNEPLAPIVLQRARMVKVMKTVAAIREKSEHKGVARLAEMLVDQLVEIMPELKDISPWHSVGQRRSANEFGRVVERRLPDDFFME